MRRVIIFLRRVIIFRITSAHRLCHPWRTKTQLVLRLEGLLRISKRRWWVPFYRLQCRFYHENLLLNCFDFLVDEWVYILVALAQLFELCIEIVQSGRQRFKVSSFVLFRRVNPIA